MIVNMNNLIGLLDMDKVKAEKLFLAILKAKTGYEVEMVMLRANDLMQGFGIQGIHDGLIEGYWGKTWLVYVSLASTFKYTLCYDTRKREFSIDKPGEIVEKMFL